MFACQTELRLPSCLCLPRFFVISLIPSPGVLGVYPHSTLLFSHAWPQSLLFMLLAYLPWGCGFMVLITFLVFFIKHGIFKVCHWLLFFHLVNGIFTPF